MSWGGDKNWGKQNGIGKGRGEYYWLASLRQSHFCDPLLEGLCCPALHHHTQKKNVKIIGHGTSHSQNSSGILSQSGTLFTKAYTYAKQRHTVHTIYTHRNTLIHTDTRVVREITVV